MIKKVIRLADLLKIKNKEQNGALFESIKSLHPGLFLMNDKDLIKAICSLMKRLILNAKFLNKANIAIQVKDIFGNNQFIYTVRQVFNRKRRFEKVQNTLLKLKTRKNAKRRN